VKTLLTTDGFFSVSYRWLIVVKVLFLKELKLLLSKPPFYVATFFITTSAGVEFFLNGGFFEYGLGSTDLNFFFSIIPYLSILAVPALTMGQWETGGLLFDESLPLSEIQLVLGKWLGAFCSSCLMLLPGIGLPVTVSFFGSLDLAQVFAGYVVIVLFMGTACGVCVFLGSVSPGAVAAYLISSLALLVFNGIHLIPNFLSLPSWLTQLCQSLSFAWHFDSGGKGIIDSRDLVFYLVATVALLKMAAGILRMGRRGSL
jgi:ABC-2 type transport system permease protein